MPAIITDQYRILNAETFIDSFVGIGTTGNNNYYTFLGHPNPTYTDVPEYGNIRWLTETPNPTDSFSQENRFYDSMLFLKKVTPDDVRRVVHRLNWQNETIYEMYKNNYTQENISPQTKSTSLYPSNYFILTSEFKVYVCINNGQDADNKKGKPSKIEPTHISTNVPIIGSDGYQWKYLFTISPSDIVKFVTDKYIPLPKEWGDVTTKNIKDAAVDGKIEAVLVTNFGNSIKIDDADGTILLPISGDGTGGEVLVTVSQAKITKVEISSGGSGYTYGSVEFVNEKEYPQGNNPAKKLNIGDGTASFEVIIPPKGGHGADVYRELGAYRVMLYSKFDNSIDDGADYVTQNNFSRVGIVRNPIKHDSIELLNSTTATNLRALKLKAVGVSTYSFTENEVITQVSNAGTAVGLVASWDENTQVLRYYQPVGFSTRSDYSFKQLQFIGEDTDGTNPPIKNTSNAVDPIVDTTFNGQTLSLGSRNINLGQQFVSGVAAPDIKKYSGDIIYIDNRAPVTRTSSQKEEVKIVIEF